jgi:hydrogenase maturation protease
MINHKQMTLFLGLGNTLLSDDGVGIYVVREIKKRNQNPNIIVKETNIGGLELLDHIAGFKKVIIIDGMLTANHKVGALFKVNPEDLKGGSAMSRHQVGFYEALELGKQLKMNLPEEIVIYGIEVKDVYTFRESCTPEVKTSISNIVKKILKENL